MPRPARGARRRGPSSLYPVWLGVLATASIAGLWFASDAPQASPADAGLAPDQHVGDAGPPVAEAPRIEWRVTRPRAVDAAALGQCLRIAGLADALVVGEAPRLTVTEPTVPRPQSVALTEGEARVRTARSGERRAWTRLHVATAACLKGPGAQLHDDEASRRWRLDDWPELGRGGGAPVTAFCALEAMPGGRRTRGLARLDLPEIGIQAEGDAADLMLLRAAAALIGGAEPSVLRLGVQRAVARPASEVPGWGGPTDLSLLVREDAPDVLLAPPPPPPEPAAKARPTQRSPKSAARPSRARPRPRRPATRPARRPVFRPDYR